MVSLPLKDWNSGLCDCLDDAHTCCYGFWCCPCMACSISAKHGENTCLPLCDILSPAILSTCGIPMCVPPAALSLRTSIRKTYNIKGSLCKDIIVSCFCMWCSWCQMHHEVKQRSTPVVNVNIHQTVIQQPAPMMEQSPPGYYVGHQKNFAQMQSPEVYYVGHQEELAPVQSPPEYYVAQQ
ncbi:cornifelin-like [Entelurus aequoreus]|uniref:cornifelin-like n=1 Tax=Entelurus aequoreus TaxID=161455 RepID=UPI002B1E3006|nr:cornifelin-like [Entelurus aequoreus]